MRSRILIGILCTVFIYACEKETRNSIPELLDDNPKVAKISIPGINDYLDITIEYEGELIRYITRPGDSIFFFYTDNQLDSALRYSIEENGQYLDLESVHFIKKHGKIIGANFKSLKFELDTLRRRFKYNADQLVALKYASMADSLIYDNEKLAEIRTYLLTGGGFIKEQYGELLVQKTFISFIDRPNPYYLISNRLGFPFFSCLLDIPLGLGNDFGDH